MENRPRASRSEIQSLPEMQIVFPRHAARQLQDILRCFRAAEMRTLARYGLARRCALHHLDNGVRAVQPDDVERHSMLVHPGTVESRRFVYEEHAAIGGQRGSKHQS